MLLIILLFLTASIYLVLYQYRAKLFGLEEMHLPDHLMDQDSLDFKVKEGIGDDKDKQKKWSPFTNRFKGLEKRVPLPIGGLKRKLLKAGSPLGILEFLAFKILALIAIPALAFMFLGTRFSKESLLLVSLAIGFLLPEMWLNGQIKKRQSRMRRDLPNVLDLLNLCVSGGLDFMLAVNRVIKDLKRCDLTNELAEVYRETQMGKSRKDALKNFAWRVDMPEVYSFVRTLVQADRMGTPLSEALNLQAEELRVRRFQHGESMALKAPVKLLFPLFAFILPVVLIIVGGPIIMQFVRGGMNFGF